jgi:ubiquinone/menaquinone biosynthesis C-methylase UbiE
MLELERVKKTIQAMAQSLPFNDDEMDAGFERLGTENVAMITDDTIIFM